MAYDKYEKLKLQYTYGPGEGYWADVIPPQYKAGELIEKDSPDCGGVVKLYRWYALPDEFICDGYSKYYKEVYQVTTNEGFTWENVEPLQTRTGQLIEENSMDCGYGVTWELIEDEYICEEYVEPNPEKNKYLLSISTPGVAKIRMYALNDYPTKGKTYKIEPGENQYFFYNKTTEGSMNVEINGASSIDFTISSYPFFKYGSLIFDQTDVFKSQLTSIKFGHIDMEGYELYQSNLVNFRNCISLTEIDMSGVTVNLHTYEGVYQLMMDKACYNCPQLKTFRFPTFEQTGNIKMYFSHLFYNCYNLRYVDFGTLNLVVGSPVNINTTNMFYACFQLNSIRCTENTKKYIEIYKKFIGLPDNEINYIIVD